MLRKCCWQQDAQWGWCAFNIDEQVCTTVLPQQLATSTAWRDVGVVANARNRNYASAAAHVQRAQDCALCAECETVGSILYIAARNDSTVINERSSTDSKL
jgi:hypothetical protein